MRKICYALLLGICCSTQVVAKVLTGHVRTGKKPMADVIVTDGLHFTFTKEDGSYSLDAPDSAKFVYILTPKGYVADFSSGVPRFYLPVQDNQKGYDFELFPMEGDAEKTLMIAAADPQIDTDSDSWHLFHETLPDMKAMLKDYPGYQKAIFMAGDLTWDVYGKNREIKDYARQLGIPFYPVIGNHDYDKYMEPSRGTDFAHVYEESFGPTYYAFQLGDNYYIVLNDIKYVGHKRYTLSLDQGNQMQWLRNLLGVVLQQDKNVFIVAHGPICQPGGTELIEGGKELRALLAGKPFHAAIFTGHIHTNSVTPIDHDIWEYNLGAVCGYWWTSSYSGDGTPNGYKVIVGKGTQWQQIYKSTGKPLDYQLQVYRPGVIADRPEDVCCKIWNWDSRWQVRWYEDGTLKGKMDQFYSFAPEYLRYLNGTLAVADYTPKRTPHFFSCHPSPSVKSVKIEAEDPYGNIYSQTLLLH